MVSIVKFCAVISVMIVHIQAAPPKWIDLSYPFAVNETIYWPGQKLFRHDLHFRGYLPMNTFVLSYSYGAGEHGGTHMDAPNHFVENGISLEKIKIEDVMGDGIVVNISAKVEKNPNAELEVSDLEEWEKKHGKIPDNPVVFMYSGRGKFWPDRAKYFGTSDPWNSSTFNFPGLHVKAAKWLIDNRKIKLFGLDTPSFDHGKTVGFPTHKVLLGAGVPGIENVAYLHRLPPRGFEVFAAPMKIKDGSGGPCRVFARIADKTEVNVGAHARLSSFLAVIAMAIALLY